jgi:hypothetical protein
MPGSELDPSAHPDPGVRKALKKLVREGWTLRREGHWGRLYCPCRGGGCTTIPVGGTPRNPANEVKKITKLADRCPLDPGDARRSVTGMLRKGLPRGGTKKKEK